MKISAENQAEILTLYYSEKQSVRSIAKHIGVDRKSVQRIIARRSVALTRAASQRKSHLDPHKDFIEEMLKKNPQISVTALLNYMRDRGYDGGYTVLRIHVREVRGRLARPKEAFLRLDFQPGQVAQVDWGEFGDVFGDGVKVHCFAMVMAFSRMIYVEFTRSEKFEEFIRCHENAFKFFGGVPRECWYDNLASAVSDRMNGLVRFNSRFMAYMGHHAIRPHACNVARGNEKGRVEDLIKYIRLNFWSGRQFADFDDLTKQFLVWRNQTANQREHRSTRRVVRILFKTEEEPKLCALNPVPYDTDEVFSRNVPPDFHLQYDTNRYSVPWTLVGMTVTVRINNIEIKIYYGEKFITSHPRSYLKGKVFTKDTHRSGLLERKPGATKETWQLGFLKSLGPKMTEYIDLIRSGPRSLKYELTRLVGLITVYGEDTVAKAAQECLSCGIIGVDNLELFLKRQHHPSQTALNPVPIKFSSDKLNRVHPAVDLRKYDALYFEGQQKTSASEAREYNGNNESISARGISESEAQVLGSSNANGSSGNERVRAKDHCEVSEPVDREGKSGPTYVDDPIKDPNGEVPSRSNGGEL